MKKKVNAAILIIGNEILSGRTQDKNVAFISNVYLSLRLGLLDLLTQTLLPIFKRPYIEPVLGQCDVIV